MTIRQVFSGCSSAAIAIVSLLAPEVVAAQVDPAANAEATQSDLTTQGPVPYRYDNEIIVTAQRRAERLEDVPLSITAISGEGLLTAGVTKFEDIGNVSPSTRIGRVGIYAQPAIRGISSSTVGTGQENNVAIYVDGFYQPDPTALSNDFANVSSVQVLKGPQGTLYGRNATGGAILIETFDPSDSEYIANATLTFGNRSDVRARAYIGVPVSDGVSFGVSAYLRDNRGYIRDIAGYDAAPFHSHDVRAKLKLAPMSDLTVTLGYNNTLLSDARGIAYSPYADVYLSGLDVPPVGPLRTDQRDKVALNLKPENRIMQQEGTLKLVWAGEFGRLSSHTSYQSQRARNAIDFDGTKVEFIASTSTPRRKTFTQSLDFAFSPVDKVDLTIGGLYFNNRARNPNGAAIIFGSLSTVQVTDLSTNAYAAFADITVQLGERLFLNAGARYSHEEKTVASRYSFRANGGPAIIAPKTSESFSDITPRASIRYEIADRTNIYGSYSHGFKSGTFNTSGNSQAGFTTPVKPEKVKAFEIGAKTARGPINAELAGWHYDYKDLQVGSLQTIDGLPTTFLGNAATAEIYGAELSLNAAVTERLNLRFGGAYTHARYKSFPAASVQLVVPVIVDDVIIGTRNLGGLSQDFSGRRLARSPDWTGSIGADYSIPTGSGEFVIAGNLYYSSKYNPTEPVVDPATGVPRFEQGAYFLGSISVDYHLRGDQFTIGAYAENVGNTRFKIQDGANGQGTYAIYNEPRSYGIRFGARL